MVQKYQSPVRVYKQPFELVMAVSGTFRSCFPYVHAAFRGLNASLSARTDVLTRAACVSCVAFRAGGSPLLLSTGTTAAAPLTVGVFISSFLSVFVVHDWFPSTVEA